MFSGTFTPILQFLIASLNALVAAQRKVVSRVLNICK